MGEFILYLFLLSIWNVILFSGKSVGLSAVLFMVPMLILIYYFFKKKKLINNKKGLLFMIPIMLLSISYLIFDSTLFNGLNYLVIPTLMILMYIFTIKPTFKLGEIVDNYIRLIFEPISCIGTFIDDIKNKFKTTKKISDNTKRIIKSLIIILPIVILVLILLSNADMIFKGLFDDIVNFFKELDIFNEFFSKTFRFLIILFIIGATFIFLDKKYKDLKVVDSSIHIKDSTTLKLLIIILDIIYIVFDFIQIKSLMLHHVASNINYASYARQGFFELMAVSLINIAIILLSKKIDNINEKDNKIINISSILMVVLTLIIIVSSFLRMNLYENAYGYTMLRLLVYISLITEVILLEPTIIYIFNPKFNIVKSYMIIIICVYTVINFANLDYLIAKRNITRYYKTDKIDIYYLENYHTDNIPLLLDLYNNSKDEKIINELDIYLESIKNNKNLDWQEYNISKKKAYHKLKDYKNDSILKAIKH